jgi:hypothetical protein
MKNKTAMRRKQETIQISRSFYLKNISGAENIKQFKFKKMKFPVQIQLSQNKN